MYPTRSYLDDVPLEVRHLIGRAAERLRHQVTNISPSRRLSGLSPTRGTEWATEGADHPPGWWSALRVIVCGLLVKSRVSDL